MKTVYLCGPINGRSDSDCNEWRIKAKSLLPDLRLLDPMRHDYRGNEDARYLEIIKNDKADIDASDALLVYFDKPSFGTAMEIYYAADQRKRVVAVNAGAEPTSPWVTGHAYSVFKSLEDGCKCLRQLLAMDSHLDAFLSKVNRDEFARIDFQHWLNGRGVVISDGQAESYLAGSNLVAKSFDGMWGLV